MATAKVLSTVKYLGALRTEATHLASGKNFITDAPVDNNGRGEAFSPTDLVATALATCALTVMGIKARSMDFDLEDAEAEVVKVMYDNPRRIGEIHVKISLRQNCDDHSRQVLEKTGIHCPVAKSIHPDIQQSINFIWK